MEWSQVPKVWPHLKTLGIRQASGLTMEIVSKFASEVPDISLIELPNSITLKHTADQIRKITQDDCKRKQRLIIRSYKYQQFMRACIYGCI